MANYVSSHPGANIDLAVTKVLNHTCGVQGCTFLGKTAPLSSTNQIQISESMLFTQGTFSPRLIYYTSTVSYPSYTNAYARGVYFKIGRMLYISFHLKATGVSQGNGSIGIKLGSLPYFADDTDSNNSDEQALSVNELACKVGDQFQNIGTPTIVFHMYPGTSVGVFEEANGTTGIPSVAADALWLGASGFFLTRS